MLSTKKTIDSYFTRKLLNIKDETIKFMEDYFEKVKLNCVTSFIFKEILFYLISSIIDKIMKLFLTLTLKRMDLKPLWLKRTVIFLTIQNTSLC